MIYAALREEIEAGPLAVECAGKSDAEIADILNDRRFTGVTSRFVTARTILAEVSGGSAILDKLEAAAPAVPDLKWAMIFLAGEGGIDIGHAGTRANLEALAAVGVITDGEAQALLQMAYTAMSRAELAGIGTITHQDVAQALRG